MKRGISGTFIHNRRGVIFSTITYKIGPSSSSAMILLAPKKMNTEKSDEKDNKYVTRKYNKLGETRFVNI